MLLSVAVLPTGLRTFKTFIRFVDERGPRWRSRCGDHDRERHHGGLPPSGRHDLKEPLTGEIFMIIDDTIDTGTRPTSRWTAAC